MSYSKQVFKILSSKLKANRRNLLINGMLVYIVLLILIVMNPTLLKYIFVISSEDETALNYIILFGSYLAYILNITLGSYKIIIEFIRKKREYLLMPFDILPKLHSIYYFTFIWIFLNTVITILLTVITLTLISIKEGMLLELYKQIYSAMENIERVIFNYGFNLFFITISLISAVAIMTFFKKEKRTVGNVFRFLVFIVLSSYLMDILIRTVSSFGFSDSITMIIITGVTAAALVATAHITAFKISVRE